MQPQNLFADIRARVHAAARSCVPDADLARVTVEPSRDPKHGDMATNAAMLLANGADKKPRELAEEIAARLRLDDKVAKVDIAGPGFINLTLKPHVWLDEMRAILAAGPDYGRSLVGARKRVNVEYVSTNPTGPVHVGHARGAVFGDALANLLEFVGFDVTREYYINDAGAQIDILARSAYLRYRESLGEDIGPIPEGLYPGDYLCAVGDQLSELYGPTLTAMSDDQWLPIVRDMAVDMMMDLIRDDLASLGVLHDVFFSERSLTAEGDKIGATISMLRANGHVYEGRLPPPKSNAVEDWEDREQTLFRSTALGDDADRALCKSDGSYTYFAADIAYHENKLRRGFWKMIDIWGADHSGYVKRMRAAVNAVGFGQPHFDIELVQLVRLLRDGEQVRMSKRAGDFITLREVVDEVGRDAVRFDMLYYSKDTTMDFDLAKVIENSSSNPVFYVQYGHARACSVLRKATTEATHQTTGRAERFANPLLGRLTDVGETSILRKLALYPRVVEGAAAAHEPHRIAFYLHDLVSSFHSQWTRGNDNPDLRFILPDDPETTAARLALVQGVTTVLSSGLSLLGVSAPNEMRHEMAEDQTSDPDVEVLSPQAT